MSATRRTLTFSVVVNDSDSWTKEHKQAAEEGVGGSYDDWAIEGLQDVMFTAGIKYIREHPDLFRIWELWM
ncbi:MAG: hypothetical protein ACREQA_19635 [Candidatus Binatia bacterium]